MSSSACRYPFVVSAPGKVIVFGEHAVVHGKLAIASAISLRSYLLVHLYPEKEETIKLAFPDIGLQHEWNIHDLPWNAFAENDRRAPKTTLDHHLMDVIKPHANQVSLNLPNDHQRFLHQQAATSFLYILLHLSSPSMPSCKYTLRSTIPIASGLGSSASINVCIGSALLLQAGLISSVPDEPEYALDLINKWAFVGELCIHGNPSGIDNTVATRGRAVVFQKRPNDPLGNFINPIHFPKVPLLLVDTKQPRSTANEVTKVGDLRNRRPSITNPVLDAIGAVAQTCDTEIGSVTKQQADIKEIVESLGELVRINHELLATLGVSHPKIEQVRQIVDGAGIGWTKLTGGGGGGCTFSILRTDVAHENLAFVERALGENGFAKYETILGAQGVGNLQLGGIPSPDVTEEDFLKAADSVALENLIGVSSDRLQSPWTFF